MDVLDSGYINLVEHMGKDSSIVECARISYQGFTGNQHADYKLIEKLIKNGHGTPFEMVNFRFKVKAPIFVARQWFRHRIGSSFNEVSARYSTMKQDFYVPNRLSSSQKAKYSSILENIYDEYANMLKDGIPKEIARCILPVSQYTTFYWGANLRSLLHFLRLRLDIHAQKEIREYAHAILELIEDVVPITTGIWIKYNQDIIAGS